MKPKTHQVILLNGPPRCGKDTAAQILMQHYIPVRHRKMSTPLKEGVASLFRLEENVVRELEAPGNNQLKDVPRLDLLGMSWRQALIWLSEEVMKPKFGLDVFGRLMVNELQKPTASALSIISDSGFRDEAQPIVKRFGAKNVHVFRIRRTGCTFEGDSRSHWEPDGMCELQEINNYYDKRLFHIDVLRRVDKIMGVPRDYDSI